jgi:hypothetical protein
MRLMTSEISDGDAQLALSSIELRRRQVIAEIDMPWWYWWGLALGWVVLGIVTDFGNVWAAVIATVAFGAAHASVAHRVLSGRHRSRRLSVRAELVSRHIPILVVGYLLLLVAVTIAIAVAVDADGADHPSTIASVIVAVAVLAGGPQLMAAMRRRAEQSAGA